MRVPLYLTGRLITLVVPRSRDEWVFGCAIGVADGALALWEQAAQAGENAVWLTGGHQDAAEAAARGIPSLPKHSVRGFWRTARARVIVVTHGFGDVNRYATSGAFLVQLWHGIPLKRIGLDSPVTTRSPFRAGARAISALLRTSYRATQRRIRLIPAASHLVRGRLESAFALSDERVPVTGEPRVDVLSQGTPQQRRMTARARLGQLASLPGDASRAILYAPTWRDGEPDPHGPDAAQWARLTALLDAHDAVLLRRAHHLGTGSPAVGHPRVQPLGSDVVADVTPLLPAMDVLITDYSSLVFDAALVPLPTVFFAPDVAEYAARRGFYGTYADIAGTDFAEGWDAVIADLERVLADPAERDRRLDAAARLNTRVHAYEDGGNTARVYRAIRAGLARDRRRTPAGGEE
nr:CDP-glycerol glycerophosphotransferase family protein [Microbacterium aquimaris]